MSRFVHLHLHSEYSLLDGACRISDIPSAARAEGHEAVAITDHGVLYGALKFYKACKAAGIKPIIGSELYVARRSRFDKEGKQDSSGYHLVLLAKNEVGYRNLIRLVSLGFTEGFYSRPRIDMELLKRHSAGLIALSGCVAGQIPQMILDGDVLGAEALALSMRDAFEPESFYLEIQNHGIPEEKTVREAIREISLKTGIPMVATNDAHYIRKIDSEAQAALMCIQTGTTLADGRPFGFERDEFYYKSTAEMEQLFEGYPDALENTARIADLCNFDFTFGKLELPVYKIEGSTPEQELRRLAEQGFSRLLSEDKLALDLYSEAKYRERMDYELSVIHQMGFDEYFLIVADFVGYAKSRGIPVGPGRGSGAGSLVAYFVGITDVDSLRYNLLFERFLNPERVSMPDFDIDFCYNRRDEVIRYVREKYGKERVSQIITFGTLAARAAVRDVGRVLGIPYRDVDEVAKLIPHAMGVTIGDALKGKELREMYEQDGEVKRLLDVAMLLEGMPRHASTHAAGVVITEKSVDSYVPLALNGDTPVTQYDMDAIAEIGLVKFDFLGLRYLTILSDAEREIQNQDPSFSLASIPLDDAAVYRAIGEGDTSGIFQLESGGMRQMLMQLQPESIEDIIAAIALYRPGPMDSIPTFIARKHGKEAVRYDAKETEEILRVTYGCIVYQEQVMQIFRTLAGYSLARADLVRRAMAKKKADVLEAERESFLKGCAKNGISVEVAGKIFDDMESFASYAFNKSHATAYAMITYRTAYLKKHYPAAYLCALLTSVLGNAPKVAEYIAEAGKRGIRVLPPDVNQSEMYFHVCGRDIRFGLLALKNVGIGFAAALIEERTRNGPYRSFESLLSRISSRELGRRQVEALIKSGAMDSLGVYRSRLLATAEAQVENALARKRGNVEGQLDFFSAFSDNIGEPSVEYPDIPEFSPRELLLLEKESSGMYFSGHLLDGYRADIESTPCDEISKILEAFAEDAEGPRYRDRDSVTLCGIITAKTVKSTKNGAAMAFLTLEDRCGEIEVIVFPKQYEQYQPLIGEENAVRIYGSLSEREDEGVKVIASRVASLLTNEEKKKESAASRGKKLFLRVDRINSEKAKEALDILRLSRGNTEVLLYESTTKKYVAPRGISVCPDDMLLGALRALLGRENVIYQ